MIDSHAHLSPRIEGGAQGLISRAKEGGVKNIILVGYNVESSFEGKAVALQNDGVFYTAGIHPSDCQYADNSAIDQLFELLKSEKGVAVGEIGLDYYYGKDNKSEQIKAFEKQLELASKINLPVVIHSRDATGDMTAILQNYASSLKKGFLMHCYSESKESAQKYLELGAYFAFGGAITFKNAKKEDIIKSIPLNRVLCETDCPYMAPVPYRGNVNESSYIPLVYNKMADTYGVGLEQLVLQIRDNAYRFFGKKEFIEG